MKKFYLLFLFTLYLGVNIVTAGPITEPKFGEYSDAPVEIRWCCQVARSSELTDTEREVLEAIDGQRKIREVVDLVQASTFDVCKILYQFLNSHLVRRRAA